MIVPIVAASPPVPRYSPVQTRYVESCGGCHGVLGDASHEYMPALRDAVGWFMCTPTGREYIVRLPNVAFAAATDEELAELVNYVVFGLGGDSVPAGTKPYTAAEVGRLRQQPLKSQPVLRMRASILEDAFARCERRDGKVRFKD